MKNLIFPVFLILGITMILGFVSAAECTDSDEGRNYFEKGTTTNMPPEFKGIWTDECVSDTGLQEGTCIEGLGVHGYQCANGCKEGACIKGEKKE